MITEISEHDRGIYNIEQILEAISPDNLWFTGEHLGRKPTAAEALAYYTSYKDGEIAKEFKERTERKRLEKKPQQ